MQDMETAQPLVTPFVGERYADNTRLADRIAPPYDVIGPGERAAFAKRDPNNIVHLSMPAGDGDPYENAASLLGEWRAGGVLVPDKAPGVYVLRQEFTTADGGAHQRTGVIGAVALEAYANGRIKPHEITHAEPKEDRLALLRSTRAMFEALLMVCRDEAGQLEALLGEATERKPVASGELQAVRIELWRVSGRRGQAMARAAGQGALYIADGHHRYETSVAYSAKHPAADRLPALIVPLGDPGLVVLPTHRLIHGGHVASDAFMKEVRDRFQIRELPGEANYMEELAGLRSRGTACVVVLPDERAVALLLKGGASLGDLPFAHEPSLASLDVARVEEMVVKRLQAAAGGQAHVDFSADAHHVIDQVRLGCASAGVLLNATTAEAVLAVADAGAMMPTKSTYFVPKVPSGLVIMGY